ncbi:MAG: PDZ domain-containing protein [Planctomycetota bacterium]|nr:PDZ domain-containing protein [Planctomycetota bacterium]
MKRIALFSSLVLSLALPMAAQAQEKKVETQPKKIKSRNQVLRETFADIAQKTRGNTVKVQVNGESTGYGVIMEGGHVLTASSIVKGAKAVQILGLDYKAKATVLGVDNKNHIALLKITNRKAQAGVALGKSKTLFIGQYVITVGQGEEPLAVGVVSAKNRRVSKSARKGGGNFLAELFGGGQGPTGSTQNYSSIIHHDSKINKKTYGSPVYNSDAKLVGINVEKAYRGSAYFVGIDEIRKVFADLKSGKGVPAPRRVVPKKAPKVEPETVPAPANNKGFLGINVDTVNGGDALKGTGYSFGARITEIHGQSGASKAGVKKGDIVVGVNGTVIKSFEQFVSLMKGKKVGDTLVLTIIRGGWKRDVSVTLGRRPN